MSDELFIVQQDSVSAHRAHETVNFLEHRTHAFTMQNTFFTQSLSSFLKSCSYDCIYFSVPLLLCLLFLTTALIRHTP